MGLLVAFAGSLAIGAWVAAVCVTFLWLHGNRPTLTGYLQGTILAGLGTLLLAELVAFA